MTPDINPRPQWDDEAAQSLLGKTVIVGLTYVDQDENVLRQLAARSGSPFVPPTSY
jgi:hypothetical protein